MNSISDLKKILLKNKILLITLIILSFVAGFIHYKNQPIKYSSYFITTNGKYDANYLEEMIVFNNIDSSHFSLPQEKLNQYKTTLQPITVNPLVGNGRYIKLNLLSKNDLSAKKNNIQKNLVDLMNHNKLILSFRDILLAPYTKRLLYVDNELNKYQSVLDSISLNEKPKKYIKLEKRVYKLQKEKIKLEDKINNTGQYYVLTPIKDFSIIKKPLPLFVFLYLFLAGVIFVLFSNKKIDK